jgi:hypothetical protein
MSEKLEYKMVFYARNRLHAFSSFKKLPKPQFIEFFGSAAHSLSESGSKKIFYSS